MSTKDRIIEEQKVTIQNLEEKIRELEGDKNNLKYVLLVECERFGKNDVKTLVVEFSNTRIFEICDDDAFKNISNQVQKALDKYYRNWIINGRMEIVEPANSEAEYELFVDHTD